MPNMLASSKYIRLVIASGALIAAPVFAADDSHDAALTTQSRDAAKQLQQTLGQALQSAMQKDGVGGAVQTCNLQAMPLTQELSKKLGADIGRTALKTRNPQNSPDAWEKKQLENFLVRLEKGEPIVAMEAVSQDGKNFRYMKAIPMQAQCAACHGGQVNPALYQKIKALYPHDQATGFNVGNLRGAFTITIPINEEK